MKSLDGSNLRKIGIGVGIALIIVLGLILGYLSADLYNKLKSSNEQISKGANQLEVKNVSTSDMRLGENATILYNRVYTKCNEVATETKTADFSMVGKSKSELSELFLEWNIADFTPNKLILQKNIDSYSPNYYKISTYDSGNGNIFVAVYTYDIEGMEVLDKVTSTPIELLYAGERENIIEGIMVEGESNLYQLLENYDE